MEAGGGDEEAVEMMEEKNGYNYRFIATRKALIKYANNIGEKPLFLFSEEGERQSAWVKVRYDFLSGVYDNWEFKSGGSFLYFLDKKLYSLIDHKFSDKEGYISLKEPLSDNYKEWDKFGFPFTGNKAFKYIDWDRIIFDKKDNPELAVEKATRDQLRKLHLSNKRHEYQISILKESIHWLTESYGQIKDADTLSDVDKLIEGKKYLLMVYEGIFRVIPNDFYWLVMQEFHSIRLNRKIPHFQQEDEMDKALRLLVNAEVSSDTSTGKTEAQIKKTSSVQKKGPVSRKRGPVPKLDAEKEKINKKILMHKDTIYNAVKEIYLYNKENPVMKSKDGKIDDIDLVIEEAPLFSKYLKKHRIKNIKKFYTDCINLCLDEKNLSKAKYKTASKFFKVKYPAGKITPSTVRDAK